MREGTHPELTQALADLDAGDAEGIVRIGLRCRVRADSGEYCECECPLLTDEGLMCERCLHTNRAQEIAAVHRFVDAHEFVSGEQLGGLMCAVCTMGASSPRHNGVPATGRTSWGDEVPGVLK